ncbi:MAG: hypothetical protein KAY61_02765, partial [Candidatus Eisenbacteria bacterium]|nr:hypothetical protein [Candidatus Eisenbacteria bacterium]
MTVSVDGPGTVTRSPDQATYPYGGIVTLTAQPIPPATFLGWSGDTTATLNPLPIATTRERHLTATFREPVTYVWKSGVTSGLWTDSLNWTPTRGTPALNDVLVFATAGTITARGVRSETVARLLVIGHANVHLECDSAATLTLRGEGGHALTVDPDAKLTLGGTSPLEVVLPRHAIGHVNGSLTLSGAAHRLFARDTSAVTFAAGSTCQSSTTGTGSPFGDGSGLSGMRSVYFAAGSRFDHTAGGDPFGAAAPNAVVAFLPGSRYVVRSTSATVSLGGRTYADFEYDAPGVSTIVPIESTVTMDSLVVRRGGFFLSQGAALVLRGDLAVLGESQLGFYTLRSGGPVVMQGVATQRITTHGSIFFDEFPALTLDNPAGVRLGADCTWYGTLHFVRGMLHTGPYVFTIGPSRGSIGAGLGTGWVNGNLRRTFLSSVTSTTFDVGDSTHFAPLALYFNAGSAYFQVTVSTTAGLHPLLASTPVDTSKSLRRWWHVTSPTATPLNLNYDAVMSVLPGELDSLVNTSQLHPLLYSAGWHYSTSGLPTATSVRATGLNLYGDLTAAVPLDGPASSRYAWSAGSSRGSFTDPGNWTPPRLLRRTDDVLEFSRGTADTAYGVPDQTIGQLLVSNGSQVTLAPSAHSLLQLSGRDGDDLTVESGSTLRLSGASGQLTLQLLLSDTTTARIAGTLEMKLGAHRLLAPAAGAIVFADGGTCVLGSGFEGNPFGTGGDPAALGSVRFASGSTLRQGAGGDPFGTQLNDAVLTFEHGSRYRIESNAFTPFFSRRTFADVEFAVPSGLVDVAPTQPFTMDSLIVRQGVFNLTPSGGCIIRGDILVYRLATLNLAPRLGPSSVRIAGDAPQRLVGTGTFATGPFPTLVLDNPAGLELGSNATWRGAVNFVRGHVHTGGFTFSVDTATVITASQATGWVNGTLRRTMRYGTPTATFAVGTDSVYAPVTVSLTGSTSEFPLAVSTTDGDHPQLATSGGDPARSVNRWWTLTPDGTTSFASGSATFTFSAADVDSEATTGLLVPFRYAGGWTQPALGSSAATSVQARGFTAFGAFAIAEPLAANAAALASAHSAGDAPVVAFALGAPSPNPSRGSARIPFA